MNARANEHARRATAAAMRMQTGVAV